MGAGLTTFLSAHWLLALSVPAAGTMAFFAMGLALTLNLLNIQYYNSGGRAKEFLAEIAKVPLTWIVMGVVLGLQLLAIYVPVLHEILGTAYVAPLHLLLPVGAALAATVLTFLTLDTRA